ncbi:UDP-galactose-lipid carrier transferase [hydrothermal vent metagenome]|uniref:UDP-galactose-lipid carrier transferase n=1 Tax=hydrothermal vent metagenome TaxID=652676 RepID=A0A3B0W8K4_9ZZZZ
MPKSHQLEPKRPFQLNNLPTDGKQFHPDRKTAEAEFKTLRKEFITLQQRLYAEGKQKLLIVLQAMDAGGKDGTIRNILKGVNPQGVRVHSFKVPSKIELAHDFLWRIHKVVPVKGMIGVFNRSHYEDVLVVRVHNYVLEAVWRPRYAQINQFEKLLSDTGTRTLKFYLHISKDEQKERFQARLDEPEKHWKFSLRDLEKRKFWPNYMAAYEEMLQECSTEWASWHVIPANQKWYRNLAIMRTIVQTLREMNPQFPEPEDNLEGVVIDD